tara:strand:+ start:9115 stop:9516 length:402 start_codon:yes stop_codon:yes gene_type:complete
MALRTTKRTAATSRKTTTAAAAPTIKRRPAIKQAYTQTQLVSTIAENTELSKADVKSVLCELQEVMQRHMCKQGAKEFNFQGLFKVKTIKKKATKARKGVNPFTGEEIMIQAKPARSAVKVQPLKKLKEMLDQ